MVVAFKADIGLQNVETEELDDYLSTSIESSMENGR